MACLIITNILFIISSFRPIIRIRCHRCLHTQRTFHLLFPYTTLFRSLASHGYVVLAVDALFWGERGRKEGDVYKRQRLDWAVPNYKIPDAQRLMERAVNDGTKIFIIQSADEWSEFIAVNLSLIHI